MSDFWNTAHGRGEYNCCFMKENYFASLNFTTHGLNHKNINLEKGTSAQDSKLPNNPKMTIKDPCVIR